MYDSNNMVRIFTPKTFFLKKQKQNNPPPLPTEVVVLDSEVFIQSNQQKAR